MSRTLFKLFLAALLFAVLLEAACQGYALVLQRQWAVIRSRSDHYFRPSANAILGYELKPLVALRKDGRTLDINRFGIRDGSDSTFEGMRKIAVLGDSIVFGTGFSQEETLPALLQSQLDPATNHLRVLNFGVPGYNLAELVEQLKVKDAVYHVDKVIYVMNPNDFCRRNTSSEGADNGLYRMYHPPLLKSPWFVRKLLYRFRKEGLISVDWYRWIYNGNRERGLAILRDMADYCRASRAAFTVVLLPAGIAYGSDGAYALDEVYNDIVLFLENHEIDHVNPVVSFSERPERYFTGSDHLTSAGNEQMAKVLARHLAESQTVGNPGP